MSLSPCRECHGLHPLKGGVCEGCMLSAVQFMEEVLRAVTARGPQPEKRPGDPLIEGKTLERYNKALGVWCDWNGWKRPELVQ